jgi:ABC-type lipoprotein release transport system permease subunit
MNFQLVEYSINFILRNKYKNIFVVSILTVMTSLLASMFFITSSMKYELNATLDSLPEIILQNTKAGMNSTIDENLVLRVLELEGVQNAISRIWGYYYFESAGVYFSLMGVDEFESQKSVSLDSTSMLIGNGVKRVLFKNYYKDYFNFIKPDGSVKKVNIIGTFDTQTELESNDVILMNKENLRDLFGFKKDEATDIVVSVINNTEVPTVALKIKEAFPNLKVLTKDDMRVSYENIFNYKSGIFLAIFIIAFFTFFIIIYDRTSGLSSEQKREIGILKALGWRVEDILKAKLYEGLLLSLFSYILGIVLALAFVYFFHAPLLRDVFIGYSDLKPTFELVFVLDIQKLFLLFFLSVPIYVAATIIPSWRVATLDADEVMR